MVAIITIWYREILNYIRDRTRIFSSLMMSILLMLVFTFALGDFDTSVLGVGKIQYMLPGIIATTIFMTSMNGALNVVTDKSEGFMKEFLVSPIRRSSIAIGKILGSASAALIQGTVILIISPLFGMRYSFIMILKLYAGMIAIAIAVAAIGLFIASKVRSAMGFQMFVQMLMMPMMFLSGAFVPIENLPTWLKPVVYINPVTYAVSAFRNISVDTTDIPVKVLERMGLLLTFGDFKVTPFVSIGILLGIGAIFMLLAVNAFKKVSITQKVKLRRRGPGGH